MRRYALRDDQWERIKDLPPGREGHVGVTAKDGRLLVEAVLHRYRAGIPWRDLPERFGAWKKAHTRLGRWAKGGVWERISRPLAADAGNEHAMIDGTIVRAPRQQSWRSVRTAIGAGRRRRQRSAGAEGGTARSRRSAAAKAA